MKEFMAVAKALADENRVRVLTFLRSGELCVCQVVEMLGLAPSTVSKHMAVLHQAGLVETRKDGRWIYYRLADDPSPRCARTALDMAMQCLAQDGRIREDARRLKCVRKMTRDELCRHYRACSSNHE